MSASAGHVLHDCDEAVSYVVLIANGVFVTATAVVCVVAAYQLIQTQREILRQRAMGFDDNNSFSILTWHVIFFVVCFVGSVSRIPYFLSLCEGSWLATHWTYWLLHWSCASSTLLLWCGLVVIHTQRLRMVFQGTPFAASWCYPVTSALVVAVCVAGLALRLIAITSRLHTVMRVSVYFVITAVFGLIVTSKMIAGAFIAKFYRFHKKMTNFDIADDCDAARMMVKSTLLAVISLISSVMAAITSASTDSRQFIWSLDVFVNCVCVYISLSMGSKYYDMLCGPLHRRLRECCVRMSRNRQTHNRTISTNRQETQEGMVSEELTTQTQTQTDLEVVSAEALGTMQRMSQRISINVNASTMAPPIQRISAFMTSTITIPEQTTVAKRSSVPIQSTLQIGVGVLAKSPDVVEFQGRSTVMDAEEEL